MATRRLSQGVPPAHPSSTAGPVAVALMHVGAGFVAVSLLAAIASLVKHDRGTAGVLLIVAAAGTGLLADRVARADSPTLSVLWGFLAAVAAAYAGIGAGSFVSAAGAGDAATVLVGAAVVLVLAVAAQLHRPATGCVAAGVLALIAVALSLVALQHDPPRQAYAAVLLVVSIVFAAAAVSRRVEPVGVVAVASAGTGIAAAIVLVASDNAGAGADTLAILILAVMWVVVVLARSPGGIEISALGSAAVLALVAHDGDLSAWLAVGPAIAGAIGALAAADLDRRSPIRPRMGGTYLLCTLLTVAAGGPLTSTHHLVANVIGWVTLLVLIVTLASVRRYALAAVTGLELIAAAPLRFADISGLGSHGREVLFAVIGLVLVAVVSRSQVRPRRPVAAVVGHGDLPSGPVARLAVPAAYAEVFDALLAQLAARGSLEHVDRRAGRLAAAGVAVAVWEETTQRTQVAVYGPPDDAHAILASLEETLPAG